MKWISIDVNTSNLKGKRIFYFHYGFLILKIKNGIKLKRIGAKIDKIFFGIDSNLSYLLILNHNLNAKLIQNNYKEKLYGKNPYYGKRKYEIIFKKTKSEYLSNKAFKYRSVFYGKILVLSGVFNKKELSYSNAIIIENDYKK